MKAFIKSACLIIMSLSIVSGLVLQVVGSVLADPITPILDGSRDSGYIPIASDPSGDLGSPGGWSGTQWTDLTELYIAADAANLYVYADLAGYTQSISTGQIGLVLDVDGNPNSGGQGDPWGNAITFAYAAVDQVSTLATLLPDFVIRGNIPGMDSGDNGWTELRAWDGAQWLGAGVNWGGISGSGQIGTHIAYSDNQGIEFAIPLTDLGNPDPASVHLQLFTTQGASSKGAYDTVPSDDQSIGWDDPTLHTQLVSVPLAIDPDNDLASPGPGDWSSVWWTDQTRLHIWADHANLYIFLPMPDYDSSLSSGSYLLALDTIPGGGSTDPWSNAITFAYDTLWQNLGHTPQSGSATPDFVIRGNIFGSGSSNNGWTELRVWNGNWDQGAGIDWGGIGNTGFPSLPGSNIAWSNDIGLFLTIPFDDINVIAGDQVNLEFLGTETNTAKGAYDTVPEDDQSMGWDDPTTQTVLASYIIPMINVPSASHDNNVWWDELGHDSRDTLFRVPGGAVPTNSPVSLRLRAASGDLTAAKVRIYDDRLNIQTILNMHLVADDGTYEWWQADVPVSNLPTVFWYRFIAIDGADTDYYADDNARLGGWGEPSDEAIDNSWQLTVYAADYQTPEWAQNAIIYQIFPDRFRDGNLSNDTPAGSFFYGENNTIYRSNDTDWNQVVCDPRDSTGVCPGIWSQNFYGGDLQGVIYELDYLQDLGISAIYFNPIFESPSNHRYDTTDYSVVDNSLGDLTLFESLVYQAGQRGMVVILDGVFNHTSSDSIYFDRYHRYDSVGACESHTSIYRDWYYFTDVTPGTGVCIGSDGTPFAANYTSWWGYDSLPKLNATNQEVRDLIYASGSSAIGPFWVIDGRAEGWRLDVGGDVDPGTTGDPNNDYWEGFRDATHAVNPDTYIIGEEWGYASSWTLGGEWDGTMNYIFSSAVLGFWRDEAFFDNDHNPGSSAGVIEPLMPSQFDERLRNLQERYAPEAFAAMMNLLGSHDTNRALFMLDHNTDLENPDIYLDPEYDWSDAINRLRGVAILQMTLPGAPTIYYGDEVGLVGPVAYDPNNDTWQDDPYNRAPFPWLDESGTLPFYTHLQSQSGQATLRDFYILLTSARNSHPALRTGSFDTLLMDDPNLIYAYGRRLVSANDAAVMILNRHDVDQTVTLDLSGYLPVGAVLVDVLDNNTQYTVASDGSLILPLVPTLSGMLLVLDSGNIQPPAAPNNLTALEGESIVDLTWDPVTSAVNYLVYRSLVSGGGYAKIGESASSNYSDAAVINGVQYYYVVKAVNAAGLESDFSNEAAALPHWEIDWANLHTPAEITHTIGLTPTVPIFGQVYIDGVTNPPGGTPGLLAQVGFGLAGTLPDDWSVWINAQFDSQQGDNDQFVGQFIPEYIGEYHYVYRYSTTSGRDWVYADLSGIFSGTPPNPGILHVFLSDDTTPPATPTNLIVADWSADFVALAWDPVTGDPSLYAYDLFRSEDGSFGDHIARILDPTTTYTDTDVTTGVTYYYRVQAIDSSFNRSDYSNQVTATPLPKMVTVTINVDVPDFTPGTLYIVGNQPELGNWDPSVVSMTQLDTNTWTIELGFLEGTILEFKFTRGDSSWLNVEKEADGNTEIPNRTLLVDYGSDGYQVVNLAVANWRDPLVVSYEPLDGATLVPTDTLITVTWSQSMTVDSDFSIVGPGGSVAGSFAYDPSSWTVTFTPAEPLMESSYYQVNVIGQVDVAGDVQLVPVIWTFSTGPTLPSYKTTLPLVQKH